MDFSNLIQGTRQFFQGHPGKPRHDGTEIHQPSFLDKQHETTLSDKLSGELFHYPQSSNFMDKSCEKIPCSVTNRSMYVDTHSNVCVITNGKIVHTSQESAPAVVQHSSRVPSTIYQQLPAVGFNHSSTHVKDKIYHEAQIEHNTKYTCTDRMQSVQNFDHSPAVSHQSLSQYYSNPYCQQNVHQEKTSISDERARQYWTTGDRSQIIQQQNHTSSHGHKEKNIWQASKNVELIQKDDPLKIYHSSRNIRNQILPVDFSSVAHTRTNSHFKSIPNQVQPLQQPVYNKTNETFFPVTQSSLRNGCTMESPSETLIRTSQSIGVTLQPSEDGSFSKKLYHPHCSVNSMKNSFPVATGQGLPINYYRQQPSEKNCVQMPKSTSVCNPAERSMPVYRDHLSNMVDPQRVMVHEQTNQQRIAVRSEFSHQCTSSTLPSHQVSQWNPKMQNITIKNCGEKFQEYKNLRPSLQVPNVFENQIIINDHLQSYRHNYGGQQFPQQTALSTRALDPFHADSASLRPPKTSQMQIQSTYCLPAKPKEAKSEIGPFGVSVIQQPMKTQAIPVGIGDAIKQNEARRTVISNYPSKCNTNIDVNTPKSVPDLSVTPHAAIHQPLHAITKLELCNYQTSSAPHQQNRLGNTVLVPIKSSRKPGQTQELKKRRKSAHEKPIELTPLPPTAEMFPMESTLEIKKSDPIVSDEKWEEWKSSFDVECDAFIKDLTDSENIKRVYRVSQPVAKKMKRKDQKVKPEAVTTYSENLEKSRKLEEVKDYSSDEDIPLSLRRKIKKEQ